MESTVSVRTILVRGVPVKAGWCVTTLAQSTSPHARMHTARAVGRFR